MASVQTYLLGKSLDLYTSPAVAVAVVVMQPNVESRQPMESQV